MGKVFRGIFVAVLLSSGVGAQSVSAEASAGLRERIDRLIADSGAEAGVAMRTLDGEAELLIDADRVFHAASTMKVPVMIELFRQHREGLLELDDPLPVVNEFHSIVDGSVYRLEAGDDSDDEIYAAIGQTRTLRELCEAMITVSSNLATNLLIEKLGVENIRRTVERLGGDGMEVLRGVEDGKAYAAGKNNTTTARGLLNLLLKIGNLEAVSAGSSEAMVEIMERQRFNEGIPSQLPAGVVVAHKTGQITRIHHDAGIVFGPRPFVLVVLVRGIDDDKDSARLIGEIARVVYEALEE